MTSAQLQDLWKCAIKAEWRIWVDCIRLQPSTKKSDPTDNKKPDPTLEETPDSQHWFKQIMSEWTVWNSTNLACFLPLEQAEMSMTRLVFCTKLLFSIYFEAKTHFLIVIFVCNWDTYFKGTTIILFDNHFGRKYYYFRDE